MGRQVGYRIVRLSSVSVYTLLNRSCPDESPSCRRFRPGAQEGETPVARSPSFPTLWPIGRSQEFANRVHRRSGPVSPGPQNLLQNWKDRGAGSGLSEPAPRSSSDHIPVHFLGTWSYSGVACLRLVVVSASAWPVAQLK